MTTYKTVLYRMNGRPRTLDRGLSLEEAQAICNHSDSSSKTCMDKRRLASWGNDNDPWFVGYTKE